MLPTFPYATDVDELDGAPAHGDRLLLWLARRQWRTLVGGMAFGIPWMLMIALVPAAIGGAIDNGLVRRDMGAVVAWSAVIFGLGVGSAVFTNLRHFFAVRNWLLASFRAALVGDHGVRRAGPALTRQVPAGEVLTSFTTDMGRMGHTFDASARFSGAIVSFVVVAGILLSGSTLLGLVLLLGGPLLLASLALVMRPLKARQAAQRQELGELTALGADTVAGLRVLRGIGGEDTFLARYAAQSAAVRAAGVRLAGVQALLDAAQVLLPGVFVLVVTGLGARLALAGEITPGQLVAYFGYTTFLTMPLRTGVEFADKLISTRIASARIARVLGVASFEASTDGATPAGPTGLPTRGTTPPTADLVDPDSSLVVHAGRLTALVSARPEETAALAERLGRVGAQPSRVRWGGVALAEQPQAWVRERILVADAHPSVFSGPLRGELGVPADGSQDERALAALHVAAAEDVLEALDGGLDAVLEERGRSLSGGQRQRLVLARALLRESEVLVLVEPTSAVDAHTEARIMARLGAARAGRTTVVTSASPLVLDAADEVVLLADGVVAARGEHHALLRDCAAYREVVARGEEE